MKPGEQLKGFAGCLGIATFFAVTFTVWKGLEVADSPIVAILPLWGVWLFCFVFDCVLHKWLKDTTNKWIIRASIFAGVLFCFFVFYTCNKGINDNRTVYFNKKGECFHYKNDCDEINQDATIFQSRRIEAERKGLKPCFCCEDDD